MEQPTDNKLAILNAHERDVHIKFQDEGHLYFIDGDSSNTISVTTIIHKYFEDFNKKFAIRNIFKSSKYLNDPKYLYYKLSEQDILDMWAKTGLESQILGTKLHRDIELYYNSCLVDNNNIEYTYFKNFVRNEPQFEIYRTEWSIYHEEARITGNIDAVFKGPNNSFYLCDWKRSKEIKKSSDTKGRLPLEHIPNANYYHYSLQLNMYKYILEHKYDTIISGMFLIILHPNNSDYVKITINTMEKEIQAIVDARVMEISLIPCRYICEKNNEIPHVEKQPDNNPEIVEKSATPIPIIEETKYKTKSYKTSNDTLIDETNFSTLQRYAYDLIVSGKNVFLTGSAGVGKSVCIKVFYYKYKHRKNIGLTSTTGTSAVLIGGSTLYSYLGIMLGKGSVEYLYSVIKSRPRKLKIWRSLDTLIIDEISMMNPELFDKLEELARIIRRSSLPFGGIQLIISGDFLQLPVVKSKMFCFEANSWNTCFKKEHIINFTKIFRQNDSLFLKCLEECRFGNISIETEAIFKEVENKTFNYEDGIIPTKIFSLNRDVIQYNTIKMEELFEKNLSLQFYTYNLEYELLQTNQPKFKIDQIIKESCNAPSELELCIGAQVICLVNFDVSNGLCNGSRGVVIDFIEDIPKVRFACGIEMIVEHHNWIIEDEDNKPLISIEQLPLKLGFSISIHASQGVSLDLAEIDCNGIFEYGQCYTALSRVRSLNGLILKNFSKDCIFASGKALEYYKTLE